MASNAAAKANGAPVGRMSLSNVKKGPIRAPLRELLYGPEGVGKSTFGADAPAPIFLGRDDGTKRLDVARFPQPESWDDILDAIKTLGTEPHEYQTLVIDTLDSIEPMLWEKVCDDGDDKGKKNNIEEFGYGKGYQIALDYWRTFLSWIERLQVRRGMNVIMLAHAQIRGFKNPLGDDFDRYQLKLNEKAGGLLKEWSESVLFANFDIQAKKESRKARAKGVASAARWIYTTRHAAYDAKNRYGLPDRLPLSFDDFLAAAQRGAPAENAAIRKSIEAGIVKLPKAAADKAKDWLKRIGEDATRLSKLDSWITGQLDEAELDGVDAQDAIDAAGDKPPPEEAGA